MTSPQQQQPQPQQQQQSQQQQQQSQYASAPSSSQFSNMPLYAQSQLIHANQTQQSHQMQQQQQAQQHASYGNAAPVYSSQNFSQFLPQQSQQHQQQQQNQQHQQLNHHPSASSPLNQSQNMSQQQHHQHPQQQQHQVMNTNLNTQTMSGMNAINGAIGGANRILLVSIVNGRMPNSIGGVVVNLNVDHLLAAFNQRKTVRKCITFEKHSQPKALIEFDSIESATLAKTELEGIELMSHVGALATPLGTLRIVFSTLEQLQVKHNSDKARDLTTHSGQQQNDQSINSLTTGINGMSIQSQSNNGAAQNRNMTTLQQQQALSQLLGAGPASAFIAQQQSAAAAAAVQSMLAVNGAASHEWSAVLLVSNLNASVVGCDVLFTLFGTYGDVLRVKVLYHKRDTAMIQMCDAESAQRACHALNHLMLAGKQMHISSSKHRIVALPRADAEPDALTLTRDYTSSNAHRFAGRFPAVHVHPPSSVLYVANIPDHLPESQLRTLFAQQCHSANARVHVQLFERFGHSQAFIRMPQLTDAVTALVNLHNMSIMSRQLRVSFANREPSQVQDTDAPPAAGTDSNKPSDLLHLDKSPSSRKGNTIGDASESDSKVHLAASDSLHKQLSLNGSVNGSSDASKLGAAASSTSASGSSQSA